MIRTLRTLVPLSRQLLLSPSHSSPSPSLLLRSLSSTPLRFSTPPSSSSSTPPTSPSLSFSEEESAPIKTPIGRINRRLQITFTCTADIPISDDSEDAKPCHHRSTHTFSKRSYEKGIVLIECPGCKNRHLIADNLSWFSSTPSAAYPDGIPIGTTKSRNIEDLVKEKGEEVTWLDEGKEGSTWVVEG
ncbi:hypothetical protein P7C70_g3823, partial [Phenoliferia sp. Uapishka_3]